MFDTTWNYTLVNISGNDIRVSNVILAILALIIALKLSNKFLNFTNKLIKDSFTTDTTVTNIIERIIQYTAFVFVSIIILQIANIPLNIFAFIGGALAIGVGLGTQGIINNFIHSVIILIERPIKIGDIIEFQGSVGKVISIGSRYVILSSFSGEKTMIPIVTIMQNKFSKCSLIENMTNYYMLINCYKPDTPETIDYELHMKQITAAIDSLSFISKTPFPPTVFLIQVNKTEDQYYCRFLCNTNNINTTLLMHETNIALYKNLSCNFSIEYPKTLTHNR